MLLIRCAHEDALSSVDVLRAKQVTTATWNGHCLGSDRKRRTRRACYTKDMRIRVSCAAYCTTRQ